jgi:HSP20 family protein
MFALTPFRNNLTNLHRRGTLSDIDEIFNRLLWAPDLVGAKSPGNIDMYEKDGHLFVSLEAPGINPDEVEVRISKDRVQLKSKKEAETNEGGAEEGKTWYSRKTVSSFNYDLSLPFEIDTDKAEAAFENGIVSISAPRLPVSESKLLTLKTG